MAVAGLHSFCAALVPRFFHAGEKKAFRKGKLRSSTTFINFAAKRSELTLLILIVCNRISDYLAQRQVLLDCQAALAQKVRYATSKQAVFVFENFCDRRHDGLCCQPVCTGSKG